MPEFSERRDALDHILDERESEQYLPPVLRLSGEMKLKLQKTVYMKPLEVMASCLDQQNYKGMAVHLSVLYAQHGVSINVDDLAQKLRNQLEASQLAGKPVASARVHLRNGDIFSLHAVQSAEFGYSKATFSSTNRAIDEALKS